jgi:hypothetical protein
MLDRSHLTDLLLETLEPAPEDVTDVRQWYVGDHEKPPQGGWQGAEGQSDWVPYIILTGTPSQIISGDIATPTSDVWFGYAVTSVARKRRSAEKMSAVARERLHSLQRQKTDDGRTIARVQVTRFGGNDRIPSEPPYFIVTDQFRIYTTK